MYLASCCCRSLLLLSQSGLIEGGWSFDAPVITEVQPTSRANLSTLQPCEPTALPCVSNWLPADHVDMLVIGYNFGTDLQFAALNLGANVSILLGGLQCRARTGSSSVYESNTRLEPFHL